MQVVKIDPDKKYVIVLPEADKKNALQVHARLKELKKGNETILVIFGDVTVIPADQVVGYTTFENQQ